MKDIEGKGFCKIFPLIRGSISWDKICDRFIWFFRSWSFPANFIKVRRGIRIFAESDKTINIYIVSYLMDEKLDELWLFHYIRRKTYRSSGHLSSGFDQFRIQYDRECPIAEVHLVTREDLFDQSLSGFDVFRNSDRLYDEAFPCRKYRKWRKKKNDEEKTTKHIYFCMINLFPILPCRDFVDEIDEDIDKPEWSHEKYKSDKCIYGCRLCFLQFFIFSVSFRILYTWPDDRSDCEQGSERNSNRSYTFDTNANTIFIIWFIQCIDSYRSCTTCNEYLGSTSRIIFEDHASTRNSKYTWYNQ